MTDVFEYVTAPTGTVHLTHSASPTGTTLCGRPTEGLETGGETLSGLAATCGTCRLKMKGA